MVDLRIIIVSFNTKDLTKKCLESIYLKKWKVKFEVWVVDNASTDGSVSMLRRFDDIHLILSDKNLGFASGNNLALKNLDARYAMLLNSDTEVLDSSLDILVEEADKNDWGIASCELKYPNGSFQANGGALPTWKTVLLWLSGFDDIFRKFKIFLDSFHYNQKWEFLRNKIGWVGGTAMLIRKDVVSKIGTLDEKIFMYIEDVEYCQKATKENFKIGWTEKAKIVHLGGGSSKNPRYNQWRGEFSGLIYMFRKNNGWFSAFLLRCFIVFFSFIRILVFSLIGKSDIAKAYAKVIINI